MADPVDPGQVARVTIRQLEVSTTEPLRTALPDGVDAGVFQIALRATVAPGVPSAYPDLVDA